MRPETLVNIERTVSNFGRLFLGPVYDIGSNLKKYREHPSQNYNMQDYFPNIHIVYVDKESDPDMGPKEHIISDATYMYNIFDNTAGGVTCCELLEHVIQPVKVLYECHRILKPGYGIIVSSLWLYPIHDPQNDFLRYTDIGLKKMMEYVGFDNVDTYYEHTREEPDWDKNSKHCSGGLKHRIGVFGFGIKR